MINFYLIFKIKPSSYSESSQIFNSHSFQQLLLVELLVELPQRLAAKPRVDGALECASLGLAGKG